MQNFYQSALIWRNKLFSAQPTYISHLPFSLFQASCMNAGIASIKPALNLAGISFILNFYDSAKYSLCHDYKCHNIGTG